MHYFSPLCLFNISIYSYDYFVFVLWERGGPEGGSGSRAPALVPNERSAKPILTFEYFTYLA